MGSGIKHHTGTVYPNLLAMMSYYDRCLVAGRLRLCYPKYKLTQFGRVESTGD